MFAIKSSTVRKDFRDICERVYGGDIITVVRPDDKNIVMLSEYQYAELEKARRNEAYRAMIDRRFDALDRGEGKPHELIED